jgi:4'-phosphopantetheinyl transferase
VDVTHSWKPSLVLTHHPLNPAGRWPEDIAVWVVSLSGNIAAARAVLSDAELVRADKYVRGEDAVRFAATRASLRMLLGERLNTEASKVRFGVGGHGRPVLTDRPELSFNVSHSGAYGLIAMSSRRSVGIDIEQVSPSLDWQALAPLACVAQERDAIAFASQDRQVGLFMKCWTAKEALLKSLGLGVTEALLDLTIDPHGSGTQRAEAAIGSTAASAAQLNFHWLNDVHGYVACVAYADH